MVMNQTKKEVMGVQVEYLGRWVDKAHFCAFVYSQTDQKLAKSYSEYESLVASGLWFPSKELAISALTICVKSVIEQPIIEPIAEQKEEEAVVEEIQEEKTEDTIQKPKRVYRKIKEGK